MKKVKELIDKHCRENKIDLQLGLTEWLDFLVDFFDYSHILKEDFTIEKHIEDMKEKSEPLCRAMIEWLQQVTDTMDKGGWIDFFGTLYEKEYQTSGKRDKHAQFFTPPSLCDLMSELMEINTDDNKKKYVNDCACGSGRTLLSHFAKSEDKKMYYIGEDNDLTSVKMCALNMMIHGMRGQVVFHDTLAEPNNYDFGFEVNEVRYPIPVPYYSLRVIKKPKKENSKEDVKENNKEMNKEKSSPKQKFQGDLFDF